MWTPAPIIFLDANMPDFDINGKGQLVIEPRAIFEQLTEEQQAELAKQFAWDSIFWNTIEEELKGGYARFSFNETMLKLRIAFLTYEDGDFNTPYDRVGDVIEALLQEIKRQNTDLDRYRSSYWKLYHYVMDNTNREIRDNMPRLDEYVPLRTEFSAEVDQLLNLYVDHIIPDEDWK